MLNETCQSTRDLLGPYVTDDLDARSRCQVEAHLAVCADCEQRAERLREALAYLSPLRDSLGAPSLSEGRREQVLSGAAAPSRRGFFRLTGPSFHWLAAACVAAVALLAGLLLIPPAQDDSPLAFRPTEAAPPPGGAPAQDKRPAAELAKEQNERKTEDRRRTFPGFNGATESTLASAGEDRAVDPMATKQMVPAARAKPRSRAESRLRELPAPRRESANQGGGKAAAENGDLPGTSFFKRGTKAEGQKMDNEVAGVVASRPSEARPTPRHAHVDEGAILAFGSTRDAKLAEVVTAPSPFRSRQVLLGLRVNQSAAPSAPAVPSAGMPAEKPAPTDRPARIAAAAIADSAGPQNKLDPLPIRISFNKKIVQNQRQIASRQRPAEGKQESTYEAVYEVTLKPQGPPPPQTTSRALNVATLQTPAPLPRQLTQEVNVGAEFHKDSGRPEVMAAARNHPELYLDACEDELTRIVQPGADKQRDNREAPRLRQMQQVLETVNTALPNDARAQTLLRQVNELVAADAPAATIPEPNK